MLENMSVKVIDIVDNINYIRLYYPQDDALRNKGSLTLVSPKYIKHMLQILKAKTLQLHAVWIVVHLVSQTK